MSHESSEELPAAAPRQPTSILRRCRPWARGTPARNEPLRRGCSPGGLRRQARTNAGLSDQDIEQALRRKAAKGDVAAARELRERARVKLDVPQRPRLA
jgi:hypothetical protein